MLHDYHVRSSVGRCVKNGSYSSPKNVSNIATKNYQNQLMCDEVMVCNISVVFLDTVYKEERRYGG